VVRAEGTAEIVEDAAPASEIPEYVRKYREDMRRLGYEPAGFALDYSVAIRVTPHRWQSW
jgi:PPOX class probable F420-dependent enzyme